MWLAFALLSAAPVKLAVLPAQVNRVAPETAKAAEQLVLNALAEMGRFTVIGSSDVSAILGFERMKDSLGCNDVACAVEIASALGADRLLSLSMSALGEQLIVTMTLIDHERAAVEARSQASVKNDERRYARAVEDALYGLFGLPAPTTSLEVLSTPAGAAVLVDDVSVGVTPAFVGRIKPGAHSVRVILQGHDEHKTTVVLKPQTPHAEHALLNRRDAKVERAQVEKSIRAQMRADGDRQSKLSLAVALGILAGVVSAVGVPVLASAPTKEAITANEYRKYLAATTEDAADSAYRDVRRAVDKANTQRGFGIALLVAGAGFGIGAIAMGASVPAKVQVSAMIGPDGAGFTARARF